ncbi:MAG: histidine kinase [Caulobacteraceae bacterium]|nr:histidine kinase [Caulobacteraceae bacterium]
MIGRARLPVVFGALAAVIAIVIVWLAQLHNDRIAWVRHTLEVENALSDLSSAVFQAEAVQRGYIVTGQEVFLGPYAQARAGIPAQVAELSALTGDNAAQHAAIGKLRVATRQKFAELDSSIALRRAGDPKAGDSLRNGSTRALTAQIAVILRAMRQTEQGLLATRTREAERLDIALLAAVAGTAILVVTFASLWVDQARKSGAALETAYDELSEVNTELLSQIASRAAAESQVRQMQKMEAVGQLTGGIAHDFNNMLAVILGNLNMIQRRLAKGKTDVGAFVESATEGANRAAALTSRLLAFSRQQPLMPEAVEPNRLVGGMSDLLNRTLGEAIVVETVLGAGLWRTRADAAQLESALVNLAVNARDAMADGGRLTIETSNAYLDADYAEAAGAKQGQYVMIAVTDTGEGMAPEVVKRAIEPFFTTKPVGKGTGLGLSQVYGFVKQTGGHLKIYSEPGQGTTVKIYLPRLSGPADAPDARPPRAKTVWRSEAQYMVLVVEDDERVRQFAAAALRELGYRVAEADGAARALARLRTEPDVALLLTDIVMPETNGRELADQAVQLKPGLPVLYMTGFTRNAVVHNGMLDPGVNFLSKPFTIDQLAAKVREAIEGAKVQS